VLFGVWRCFSEWFQSNPIQSNVNKRAQVFLFARIFYNITFTYKLKHLRFQLTRNENCKEHLDQASVCLDDFFCLSRRFLKVLSILASTTESGKLFHILTTREQKENFLKL